MAVDPSNGVTNPNLQVILASVSPILAQLPKWIELGAYLEFGDDEVRLCDLCHDVCEWVYFKLLQFNFGGLELCGICLEKYKKRLPWKLYVREGLITFLGSLNALVSPPVSEEPAVELGIKPSNTVQGSVSAPSDHSPQTFPSSGQLLKLRSTKPVSDCALRQLAASSQINHVGPTSGSGFLSSDSGQIVLTSSSDQLHSVSGSGPVVVPNTGPIPFTSNSEQDHFASRSLLLSPSQEPQSFLSKPEPMLLTVPAQFISKSDPVLLTTNSDPVLFTSNAEPVHFISLSKPVLVMSNSRPDISTACPKPVSSAVSLTLTPKSEPLLLTSSDPTIFASNLESVPETPKTLDKVLCTSNLETFPVSTNYQLGVTNAEVAIPHPDTIMRTQSKSGKKVSDGALVDRMRTILQQDCRVGKDLFTTGIELADRYNSYYKHETIHVRRIFEAMKSLGYSASKDTMQVQVEKVKRKVKLIYGVAMK